MTTVVRALKKYFETPEVYSDNTVLIGENRINFNCMI